MNPLRLLKSSRRITLLVLVGTGVIALSLLRSGSREPSYQGKSLRQWIYADRLGEPVPPQKVTEALTVMRDQAVPYLVQKLRWKPARIMAELHRRYPRLPLVYSYMHGGGDPRGDAAYMLGQMGTLASNAIPDLHLLYTGPDVTPSSWHARICAQAAMLKIRQAPLTPYIEKLTNTANPVAWYQNALMIGEFGTNAIAAIPNLVAALGPTNHPVIQNHACVALSEIHSQPEVCVPALVPMLKSADVAIRQNAMGALMSFGKAAKPAWNDIAQAMGDPDPWTARLAAKALKAIDAEAARKASAQ